MPVTYVDLEAGISLVLESLRAFRDAIGHLVRDFVALANPAAVFYFNMALRDLAATVGQILLPVLHQMTGVIRVFADVMLALPQPVKDFIAAAVTAALVLTGFKVAIYAVSTAITLFRAVIIASSVGIITATAPFLLLGAVVIGVVSLFVDLSEVIRRVLKFLGIDTKNSFGLAVQPVSTSSIQGIGIEAAKKSLEVGGVDTKTKVIVDAIDRNGKTLESIDKKTGTGSAKGGGSWEALRTMDKSTVENR